MATDEKRVKLGVDIGALNQDLSQINKLVEENYKISIQNQQNYNKALKESISLLNEQVGLVGEMSGGANQIVSSPNGQSNTFDSNRTSDTSFSQGYNQNQKIDDNEIRKIIIAVDRIKRTMRSSQDKEETEENSDNLEYNNELLSQIKELVNDIDSKLDNSSDKDSTQRANIQDVNVDSEREKLSSTKSSKSSTKENVGNKVQAVSNKTSELVAKDPNYLLPAALAAIPYLGAGLSGIVTSLMDAAKEYISAHSDARATTGGFAMFEGMANLGLNNADSLQKGAQYFTSNARVNKRDIEFEKGFAISSGVLSNLLSSVRRDIKREQYAPSDFGAGMLGSLITAGVSNKEVRAYSEDYLSILVDVNKKQLETLGQTNSVLNTKVISQIAGVSRNLRDPQILGKVVSSIQSGLQQADSPQMEALQYYALQKINPNATMWDLQRMKENPFGNESRGYFSQYLNELLKTGTGDEVKFNIQKAFNLSAHQTDSLVNGILEERRKNPNFSIEKFLEGLSSDVQFGFNVGRMNVSGEASAATPAYQILRAQTDNLKMEKGQPILNWATELGSDILKFATEKLPEYYNTFKGFITDFWGKMGEFLGGIKDGIVDGIKGAIGGVTNAASAAGDWISDKAKAAGQWIGIIPEDTVPAVVPNPTKK